MLLTLSEGASEAAFLFDMLAAAFLHSQDPKRKSAPRRRSLALPEMSEGPMYQGCKLRLMIGPRLQTPVATDCERS